MNEAFKVVGKVEIFPQKGGWHFIRVPNSISDKLAHKADRGVIAISATIGKSSWDTSLLPKGDGTHFVALNAKIRKSESIKWGSKIEVRFALR